MKHTILSGQTRTAVLSCLGCAYGGLALALLFHQEGSFLLRLGCALTILICAAAILFFLLKEPPEKEQLLLIPLALSYVPSLCVRFFMSASEVGFTPATFLVNFISASGIHWLLIVLFLLISALLIRKKEMITKVAAIILCVASRLFFFFALDGDNRDHALEIWFLLVAVVCTLADTVAWVLFLGAIPVETKRKERKWDEDDALPEDGAEPVCPDGECTASGDTALPDEGEEARRFMPEDVEVEFRPPVPRVRPRPLRPKKTAYSLGARMAMLVSWGLTALFFFLGILLSAPGTGIVLSLVMVPLSAVCVCLIITAREGKEKRLLTPLALLCIPDFLCIVGGMIPDILSDSALLWLAPFLLVFWLMEVLLSVTKTVFSCVSVVTRKRPLLVTALVLTLVSKLMVFVICASSLVTPGSILWFFTLLPSQDGSWFLSACVAATVFELVCLFGTSEPKQTPPGDKPE